MNRDKLEKEVLPELTFGNTTKLVDYPKVSSEIK